MPTAGELIRHARREQRRSASDVARAAGLTEDELFMIEAGGMTLWCGTAWHLARTLSLDVEELCEAAAVVGVHRV